MATRKITSFLRVAQITIFIMRTIFKLFSLFFVLTMVVSTRNVSRSPVPEDGVGVAGVDFDVPGEENGEFWLFCLMKRLAGNDDRRCFSPRVVSSFQCLLTLEWTCLELLRRWQ